MDESINIRYICVKTSFTHKFQEEKLLLKMLKMFLTNAEERKYRNAENATKKLCCNG